jgi:hypothetical protein
MVTKATRSQLVRVQLRLPPDLNERITGHRGLRTQMVVMALRHFFQEREQRRSIPIPRLEEYQALRNATAQLRHVAINLNQMLRVLNSVPRSGFGHLPSDRDIEETHRDAKKAIQEITQISRFWRLMK